MKPWQKLLLNVALVVAALLLAPWGIEQYRAWRVQRDEEALNEMVIPSFQIFNASRSEVIDLLKAKLQTRGYTDLPMQVFREGHAAPGFHKIEGRRPTVPSSGATVTFTLGAIPLEDLLKYISAATDSTWEVKGRGLVIVMTPGTTQRFRRETFKLAPSFFEGLSDRTLAKWAKDHGITPYEGVTVEFRRRQSEVEIYAPESEIEVLAASVGADSRRDQWEQIQGTVIGWRQRVLGW